MMFSLKTALVRHRALLLCLSAVSCSLHPRSRGSAPLQYDSAQGVASFDSAWTRLAVTYYDTTFKGHDWKALRDTLRPRAERARSRAELRATIQEMFERLGDSHLMIIPGELARGLERDTVGVVEAGDLGLELRLVDDRLVAVRVAPSSAAEKAGIRAGAIIERIDDIDITGLLKRRAALRGERERSAAAIQIPLRMAAEAMGEAGSSATIRYRERENARPVTLKLNRSAWPGEVVRFGLLPPQYFQFERERLRDADGCIGVIRFSSWMTPVIAHMERAMEELRDCRGIVLDLRGNLGGVGALVTGVSGFFVDREQLLGTLTGRNASFRYNTNPRRLTSRGEPYTPFPGPLAILVDRMSVSTSEFFAAGMKDIGRARVFGERTPGEALPALMSKLPNGDLMMAPMGDFKIASGWRLEGSGVVPDEEFPLRTADLRAGVDLPLTAAIRWISRARSTASTAATLSRPQS